MDNNYTSGILGNQPEYILQSLKTRSYATISVEHWTPEFRTKLRRWLSKNGYPRCRFYKIDQDNANNMDIYVIALPDANIPYSLEMEYTAQKSVLQKLIPLWLPLVTAFCILFYTTWVAKLSEDMVALIIIIGVPLILSMLVEYFINLNNKPSSILKAVSKVIIVVSII